LLDRIDLHVEVTPVNLNELTSAVKTEKSEAIRNRVIKARNEQTLRFSNHPYLYYNAQMTANMVRRICEIDDTGRTLIKKAMEKLGLSARAYDRILKVSRTIADLDRSLNIELQHLAEAIHYRSLDREHWMG